MKRYSLADFSEYAVAGPPTTFTGSSGGGIASGALDPNATPPADKFEALYENNPAFARTWKRERPDFTDQSPSTYDMSLASFAANVGWDDDEIVALLIAGRRHHDDDLKLREDYYARTIARARGGRDSERHATSASRPYRPSNGSGDEDAPERISASGDLPKISVSRRPMRDIVADGWQAVRDSNDPPWLYLFGNVVAEVRPNDESGAYVRVLDEVALKGHLDRVADWTAITERGPVPARPPKDATEDMLKFPADVPPLRGIVGTPTLSAKGEILVAEGYQAATGLIYAPIGEPVAAVPAEPTASDVARAVSILTDEWLGEFPGAARASRANTIGAALTPIVRPVIDGPTPLFAIDAPAPGTGKSFLADSLGILTTGRTPAVTTAPRDGDEWRKRITSLRHWGGHTVLIEARDGAFWDAAKIGLSPPPIETPAGWLIIYHGVHETPAGGIYQLGLALLDLNDPSRLLRRGEERVFACLGSAGSAPPSTRSATIPSEEVRRGEGVVGRPARAVC